MMSIEDYAQDVGKTVEEIYSLCDKLGIAYKDSNTMLDDTAIILLDNKIQEEDNEPEVSSKEETYDDELYDYEYDEDLLGDYFDDAVEIIRDWKKASDTSLVLTGNYDRNIVQFIIESINISGLEGQSISKANGITKTFIATPEANLKASIPQSI